MKVEILSSSGTDHEVDEVTIKLKWGFHSKTFTVSPAMFLTLVMGEKIPLSKGNMGNVFGKPAKVTNYKQGEQLLALLREHM